MIVWPVIVAAVLFQLVAAKFQHADHHAPLTKLKLRHEGHDKLGQSTLPPSRPGFRCKGSARLVLRNSFVRSV